MNNFKATRISSRADEDGAVQSRFHRLLEPRWIFAAMIVVVLAVIWGTTWKLVERERTRADRAAAEHVPELADIYEARVLRAMRQIDNTLDLVRYSLANVPPAKVLEQLRSENLLPPAFIFTVTVSDNEGRVVASTRAPDSTRQARQGFFQDARNQSGVVLGQPRYSQDLEEWRLSFSRAIIDARERFSGVVTVSTSVNYFVSSYYERVMGEEGVLALVGADGVTRARNTGKAISAGEKIDYQQLLTEEPDSRGRASVKANPWDDVPRYTVARKLYGYPLAIVVGLSQREQMAPATELRNTYFKRAGIISLVVLIVMGVLGRLTQKLQKARARFIQERVKRARQVEYMAFHDELTRLPNRAFFSQLLSQSVQQAGRYDKKLILMFLDLDGFKTINDSLGHDAGDELLREMARRLTETLRESDIVARLGGDEFVILLPEVQESTEGAVVAEKILAAIAAPFDMGGQKFRISVSIGIAVFPEDSASEETLMKSADLAMYHAKERGKNNFHFYSEELNNDSLERLARESSLRKSLENNEFRLYYQAKRDMQTGHVVGMEALLRWDHPVFGLTEPMDFVPQAEESGLILPIGRWVLNEACQQNVNWQKRGFPRLSVAVNLSARQFQHEHLIDDIQQALEHSGMEPELLELEITESMIIPDMKRAVDVISKIKTLGVRVAIDDFGAGYSSLSSLRDFPLDAIKIDQSYIRELARNMEDRSLTEAVITVGRNLSLTVIAEGVESWEQADFLRTRMCEQFQGFYINEPVPPDEFTDEFSWQLSLPANSDTSC